MPKAQIDRLMLQSEGFLRDTLIQNSRYIPLKPGNQRQMLFLAVPMREVFYGGAAGGAKSTSLLAAALMYVHVPNYNALIVRRTLAELAKAGALIDMSKQWLTSTDAKWNEQQKRWTFPSGATLEFGYIERMSDVYQFQSAQFNMIGFDELTQFEEGQYLYLFSRLRREVDSVVPSRMRSASNPGGVGHDWVKRRFVTDHSPDRIYIPAKLDDNPFLDKEEYRQSLAQLPDDLRRQLEDGDWDATPGAVFSEFRRNIHVVDPITIPKHWARFGGNDPHNAGRGVWYWCAVDESQNVWVYREWTFPRMTAYRDQAQTVREMTKDEQVDYYVTGMDAFNSSPETGKCVVDYYAEGGLPKGMFRKPVHGVGCRANMAATLHDYLRPVTDPDSKLTRAKLRIFSTCGELIATMPTLQADPAHGECVIDCDTDHWYQALGYGLQSRHVRQAEAPTRETSPWTYGGRFGTPQSVAEELDAKRSKRDPWAVTVDA